MSSSSKQSTHNQAGKASKSKGKDLIPIVGKKNVLITSALPYVNNVPHLGNIIGSVLSADVYARFLRLRGTNTLFICGTDEYGTATETKALQEGLTPQQICDKYYAIHKQVYDWFNISFDHFGRTSRAAHTTISQEIFTQDYNNGFLIEQDMKQPYCIQCKKFLADRFVEGVCPHCLFDDARGDQCDHCQKLLNPIELKSPRCKFCRSSPEFRDTTHMFLDLEKLQSNLKNWVTESFRTGLWSSNATSITNTWLSETLKPRCITRDLKWGVPVPLPGYEEKVLYVWFDAPIGYISITAEYTKNWEMWWKNPKQVELVQFMGKDNVPFHSVIFPAMLISTKEYFTLVNSISSCEYLQYEGGKFSKSRNTGVFGDNAFETGIPSEVWRYYLLVNRPENGDSVFSWDDFMLKNNGELLNSLGNFVNRTLKFVSDKMCALIPELDTLKETDTHFIEHVNTQLSEYLNVFSKIHIKDALRVAVSISISGNKYLQENKPWELIDNDAKRCGTVMNIACNLISLLVVILEPFIPTFSDKVRDQLNFSPEYIPDKFEFSLNPGNKIGNVDPIFYKLEKEQIDEFKTRFGGAKDNTFPADLRTGVIESVSPHSEAMHLYVFQVDLGKEKRQIVSSLREVYPNIETLQNKKVVVLCNIKPTKFQGVLSQGVLLTAESQPIEGKSQIGLVLHKSPILGQQIVPHGYKIDAKPKFSLQEFAKLDLKLNKQGNVVFSNQQITCQQGVNDFLFADHEMKEGNVK